MFQSNVIISTKIFFYPNWGLIYEVDRSFILDVNTIGGHNSTCTALAGYLNLPSPVGTYIPKAYEGTLYVIGDK